MNNNKAIDEFVANVEDARELIAAISEALDSNLYVDVETLSWGHVGNSKHVLESIRELARFLDCEE